MNRRNLSVAGNLICSTVHTLQTRSKRWGKANDATSPIEWLCCSRFCGSGSSSLDDGARAGSGLSKSNAVQLHYTSKTRLVYVPALTTLTGSKRFGRMRWQRQRTKQV